MIVIVGGGNLGPVASLAITALFLLVPSIIETLTNRERPDATVLPAYFVFLFLQVLVPIASLGLITALLINERFRRFLRLGTLDDENHDQGTHARPRTPRSTTAAAAGIRKLPLIKYRTRRDLEALSLKGLGTGIAGTGHQQRQENIRSPPEPSRGDPGDCRPCRRQRRRRRRRVQHLLWCVRIK